MASISEHPQDTLNKLDDSSRSMQQTMDRCSKQQTDIEALLASLQQTLGRWDQMKSDFDTALRRNLQDAFGLSDGTENLSAEERAAVLGGDCSVSNLAARWKAGEYKKVLVLTGAGVSVSAGIPDFRTPGTGLYDNLQKYNLPTPQSVFDIEYFKQNPEPYYQLSQEMTPGNFNPTLTHCFVRLLADKGVLLRNYTQNIDTLERRAGVPLPLLVEAHGSFGSASCTGCHAACDPDWLNTETAAGRLPRCAECQQLLKHDIVFFGEALPQRFVDLHSQDLQDCDLVLVMGTSLSVAPFSSLPNKVSPTTPRVLLNREAVGTFRFDSEDNFRDVPLLGACDDGVLQLATLLGWRDELLALAKEHGSPLPEVAAVAQE